MDCGKRALSVLDVVGMYVLDSAACVHASNHGMVVLWCGLREHIRERGFDWCGSDGWLMRRGDGWGMGSEGQGIYIGEW